MSDRNETTVSRQLAEKAAVYIVGKRNSVTDPLDPIEWIRQRKVNWLSEDKTRVAIWFLFQVSDKSQPNAEFYPLTAVTVLLTREDKNKKWNLVSAKLESEYQPTKPNIEMWEFDENGVPFKIS